MGGVRRTLVIISALVGAVVVAVVVASMLSEDRAPVLVLGDSLCIDAQYNGGEMTSQLHARGWEPSYTCRYGEPIDWGIAQVRTMSSVPATVVVALGTNGGTDEADFAAKTAEMRDELTSRGAERIVWMNLASADDGYEAKNLDLLSIALDDGDVLVDWSAKVAANPAWFRADGIHYTADGAWAWAGSIADALGDAS